MFRRRRSSGQDDAEDVDTRVDDLDVDDDDIDGADDDEAAADDDSEPEPLPLPKAVEHAPTTGPWDAHDVPDDGRHRLDFGGLRVAVEDGLEIRIDSVDDTPIAVTVLADGNALQVSAFAAPRSAGLWAEVLAEIATALHEGPGGAGAAPAGQITAQEQDGPFGVELQAVVPDEHGHATPARFFGVDGPRWFVRGVLTGPAATDPAAATRMEELFRQVVVVRGRDAMAPRDLLPLHVPQEVVDAGEQPTVARTLELPERGPEITEIQ